MHVTHRRPAAATLAVAALATLVGCSREAQVATAPPASSAPVSTTAPAAPTSAPASTPAPVTAATTAPASSAPASTAAPTTAPTPATTVAPTTPATPPSTAAPAPTDRVVVTQYGLMPIGVWDGAGWQHQAWGDDGLPTYTPAVSEAVFTGVDLPAPVPGGTFDALDYFCVGDEQAPRPVPPPGVELGEADSIAVSADWNVQPRPVRAVGAANPEYAALGASLVDPASGADPAAGEVRQVVRADLDGNGVEEVLLTYARQTPDAPFGTAGDYTLVIARYPHADGTVDDAVLWSYYEQEPVDFPDPADADLLAVADLNGDGVMEVVIAASAWEQLAVDVHALVDGRLTRVTGGGCGV